MELDEFCRTRLLRILPIYLGLFTYDYVFEENKRRAVLPCKCPKKEALSMSIFHISVESCYVFLLWTIRIFFFSVIYVLTFEPLAGVNFRSIITLCPGAHGKRIIVSKSTLMALRTFLLLLTSNGLCFLSRRFYSFYNIIFQLCYFALLFNCNSRFFSFIFFRQCFW